MNKAQKQSFKETFAKVVSTLATRDIPIYRLPDGKVYSPNAILREVEQETPFGKTFMDAAERYAHASGESFDRFVRKIVGLQAN